MGRFVISSIGIAVGTLLIVKVSIMTVEQENKENRKKFKAWMDELRKEKGV